jgi:rubrerythrin
MPIYEPNEKEIMKEYVTLIKGEEEESEGTLFLTDRRLIYERKGKRGVFKATSPQVVIDIPLYEITNLSDAIPRFKAFTKKTITVEYNLQDHRESSRFEVKKPKIWNENIRKWAIDAKRIHEEEIKRSEEETHRKEVEMARAKAGTTNVGVMHVNTGAGREIYPDGSRSKDTVVDAEDMGSTQLQAMKKNPPTKVKKKCKECGYPLDDNMKYCPNCGTKVE